MNRILMIAGLLLLTAGCGEKTDDPAQNRPKKKQPIKKKGGPKPLPSPSQAQVSKRPVPTVRGKLRGKPFVLDQAKVMQGNLVLTQGKGAKDARYVSLLIFLKSETKGRLAGKSLQFSKQSRSHPHIHLRYNKKPGSWRTGTDFYMSKYEMKLVFGPIKDGKLPGKISLRLGGAKGGQISGDFVVPVTWFREDAPDLTLNDGNALGYLARKHLEKQFAGKKLTVTRTAGMRPSGMGKQGSGQGLVYYKVDGGAETFSKFIFTKQGNWRVQQMLRKDQVMQAHPLKLPTAKSWDHQQANYIIGRWLEREMQTRHTDKGFVVGWIRLRQSRKVPGVGFCKVTCTIDGGEKIERQIWVKKRPSGAWMIVRPLTADEQFDLETGKPKKK